MEAIFFAHKHQNPQLKFSIAIWCVHAQEGEM